MLHLRRLLSTKPGVGVGDLDVKLLSALDDDLAVAAGHVGGDLSAVVLVVHHQELELLDVGDDELEEAVG